MLTSLIQSWNTLYSTHAALRSAIGFIHIGGLLTGGGCAITADLATLSAVRDSMSAQVTELRVLKRTHELVVAGLVALTVSGVLMFAADIETYLYSRLFWIKMGMVVLLLANGLLLLRAEKRVRAGDARGWIRLHHIAVTSLVLWFLTTLVGAALPNFA